jgi:glycosyltransferase involved in cell wall biosynthesis
LKILQLVSDWKWTGPAEPMLVLTQALRDRGHQVDLVCPEAPVGSNRSLWQEASSRRLDAVHSIEPLRSALRWGDGLRVDRVAQWALSDTLGGPYDIVHCWHTRDHVLASRALRKGYPLQRGRRPTRVIRSLSHVEPVPNRPWNRWLFGPGCDGVVCVSDRAAHALRRVRGERLTASTTGAIDLSELENLRSAAEIRKELGLEADAPLIGVVARMQSHRRFDLILSSMAELVRERPDAKLVIIGRGTRTQEIVTEPALALGIEKNVVLAGYRVEDYPDVLSAMDLITYLVPGSDGTCRALLQAAALGLPAVGSWRGAVPDIVSNGQTGILIEEDREALVAAWRELIDDPVRRKAMGEAARKGARERFCPDRHAAWMERFYEEALRDDD